MTPEEIREFHPRNEKHFGWYDERLDRQTEAVAILAEIRDALRDIAAALKKV